MTCAPEDRLTTAQRRLLFRMWWFTTPSQLARDLATIPEVPA